MLEKFTAWMFRFRTPLVCVFAVLTVVMAYFALHLRVDASFNEAGATYSGSGGKYESGISASARSRGTGWPGEFLNAASFAARSATSCFA